MAEEDGVEGDRSGELEIDVRRRELRVGWAAVPLGGRTFRQARSVAAAVLKLEHV